MRALVVACFALLSAGWVSPARAHLVETGFGDFYDGIAHVAATPSDLLAVIAFALLAGQHGARASRWTLLLLPLAWLSAGMLGAMRPVEVALPVLTTLTFGVAGALVALKAPLPTAIVCALAVAAGAVHGFVNGATMMAGGASGLALAGAGAAAFSVVAILSAHVSVLRAGWTSVAVRVAGSWLAAAAILMLGWLARPGA